MWSCPTVPVVGYGQPDNQCSIAARRGMVRPAAHHIYGLNEALQGAVGHPSQLSIGLGPGWEVRAPVHDWVAPR